MPTHPDFFCHYKPRARYDIERIMPKFETVEQAERYRHSRIAILRKGGRADKGLAEKLEACGGEDGWCLSRACPVCARFFRRWIIGEALRILRPRTDLLAATLVMPERQARPGRLQGTDTKAALATMKRQLERAGIPNLVVVGGLDISLEIDRRLGRPNLWQPHVHFISSGCSRKDLRQALAHHYPATDRVPEPVHIDLVRDSDRPKQISYCFKSLYRRRVSTFDKQRKPSTPEFQLRGEELREVCRFVDRYTYPELVIMKGIRRYGSELRLLPGR
jgi:hypothetical protein